MIPNLRHEQGSSLAAIMAVLMVVSAAAATAVSMAMHANDVSIVDRERLLAVQAAEAGVGGAMERLESSSACDTAASSPVSLIDQDKVLAWYQTKVEPETGSPCASSLVRVIRSWGQAPKLQGRTLRQLEVTVRLIPGKGFRFSLFASGSLGIVTAVNTPTIQGDIYAESLDQTQNNISARDVITPGSIDTKDNAVYAGTLWAGGNITLRQNGQVAQSLIASGDSAPGNILLENNVNIGRDVRAAGTISLPTTYTIGGSVAQGDTNLPAPPNLERPTFTWDPANYDNEQIFATGALLSAELEARKTNLQGVFYTADATTIVELPKSATVTGPLTVVTSGKVQVNDGGGTSFSASGGPWQVVIVSLNAGLEAIRVHKPSIFAPGLDVLFFTNGEVAIKNNITMTGALYADSIYLKNAVTVTFSQSLAENPPAGFDFTLASAANFVVVPVLWREVAPGAPPT